MDSLLYRHWPRLQSKKLAEGICSTKLNRRVDIHPFIDRKPKLLFYNIANNPKGSTYVTREEACRYKIHTVMSNPDKINFGQMGKENLHSSLVHRYFFGYFLLPYSLRSCKYLSTLLLRNHASSENDFPEELKIMLSALRWNALNRSFSSLLKILADLFLHRKLMRILYTEAPAE